MISELVETEDNDLTPIQRWLFARVYLSPNSKNSLDREAEEYSIKNVNHYTKDFTLRETCDIKKDYDILLEKVKEEALQLVEQNILVLENNQLKLYKE